MTKVKQLIENWLLTHPNASIEDTYMAGYGAGLYEGYEKCQNDVLKAMEVKDIRVNS